MPDANQRAASPSNYIQYGGQDLRYAIRTLARARAFSLTVILVTAPGVGANTAAFSVADFVLLRPLPFPDPDSLVRICEGPRVEFHTVLQHSADNGSVYQIEAEIVH